MSRKLIRVFSSALMVLFDHIFHFSKRLPICSNTRYWLAIDHPSDIPIYTKGEWKVPPRKKKLHKNKSPFGNITWSFWWMYQKCKKCNSLTMSWLQRCWWRMLETIFVGDKFVILPLTYWNCQKHNIVTIVTVARKFSYIF